MRCFVARHWRRCAITTVIAVAPIAIVCAYVTNLLVPTAPLPRVVSAASLNIIETAGIVNSDQTIGMSDSDIYDPNLTDAQVIERIQQMQNLGVDTIRVLVPWGVIRPVPPGDPLETFFPPDWKRIDLIISQAQQRNMAVLGVLNSTPYYGGEDGRGCVGCYGVAPDPQKFAAFASEAVTRLNTLFPGVISAYEVWNEPNLYQSWMPAPDPVAYTELLKQAYTAIKAADPNALVVAGVLTTVINWGDATVDPRTFLATMYANGAKGFFDALSIHPYSYQQKFSDGDCNDFCQNTPLQQLIDLRQMMIDNGDQLAKIWATEYGLGTALLTGTEEQREQQQSDWIKDFLDTWATVDQDPAYQNLGTDWLGPAFIYTIQERLNNTDENGSLGIFKYGDDWIPKLAAIMLKKLIEDREAAQNPTDPTNPTGPGNPGAGPGTGTGTPPAVDPVAAFAQSIAQALTHFLNQINQLGQAIAQAVSSAVANLFNGLANLGGAAVTPLGLSADTQHALAVGSRMAAASVQAGSTTATDKLTAGEGAAASAADEGLAADEATTTVVTDPTVTERPNTTEEPAATEEPKAEEPKADEPKKGDEPNETTPGRKHDESNNDSPKKPDNKKPDGKKGDAKKGDAKKGDERPAPGRHTHYTHPKRGNGATNEGAPAAAGTAETGAVS
ncbi:polysaccharide biosynthesis protein PslG [Mycobacterium sp. URHB0021]